MTDMIEAVKVKSSSAKCYEKKIKNDAEFYTKEKKKVAEYMKEVYKTDDAYKERTKEQKRASYYGRKEAKINASILVN